MQPLGATNVGQVTYRPLTAKITNMAFFDKLKDLGIVRETGHIRKCFDEYVDGLQISDELRKILIMEESEQYDEFSAEERSELIFHIFRRLVVGGSMCQYEDFFEPYAEATKKVYKDFVSVQKNPATKELQVVSMAVQIDDLQDAPLFPEKANRDQSFCYVIVEPIKRHVIVWYSAHLPIW
mmetsp:Transcript_21982/g.52298  ORF Transcript_21982/g.52298 Transcript_21982/m.52298 type:complete len:181 (-) Transcript_21982:53-595(-)